jgi:hypothetical protein
MTKIGKERISIFIFIFLKEERISINHVQAVECAIRTKHLLHVSFIAQVK